MKRKNFIKISGTMALAYSLNPLISGCTNNNQSSTSTLPQYWLWMRPQLDRSDDYWKETFDQIRAIGIEAILPQVYASNKALFYIPDHEVEERLLERLIPIAHSAGLQVHAWMWTMICNNPRIITDHPHWYAVNRSNQAAHAHPAYVDYYKFLCPRREEVRLFVQNRVKALSSISELDGIHLDYVRMPDAILAEGLQPKYNIVQDQEFPEYDYCYCEYCRSGYQEKYGADPLSLADPSDDDNWRQYRYDAVIDLVNDYLVPVARAHKKTITAAVFPNWESVRQQWHRFDLDAFLPMLYHGFYNQDIDWIAQQTAASISRFNKPKPIYSGLFLPHLDSHSISTAVDAAYRGGARGFSLFSYNDMSPEMIKAVSNIVQNRSR